MVEASNPVMQKANFHGVNPVLHVADVAASIENYVQALGFTLNWQTAGFASVNRGKVNFFLCEDEQGQSGSWVYISVDDVDAIYSEYQSTGVKIRNTPQNYDWGYELQVEDIDGNVLRLGSDRKPGAGPGEWLRDDGSHWRQLDRDRWERV